MNFNNIVFYFIQGTILVNNSDKPLKWMFNLSEKCETLDEGIFKFTHPSGVPFVVMSGQESKGIEGTLDPGKTQQISVIFCPSMHSKCYYIMILYTIIMKDMVHRIILVSRKCGEFHLKKKGLKYVSTLYFEEGVS